MTARASIVGPLLPVALGLCVLAGSPRATLAQQRTTGIHGTLALGTGSMGFSGLVSGAARMGHGAVGLRMAGNLPDDASAVAGDLGLVVSYVASPRHAFLAAGAGVAAVFTGDSARAYTTAVNPHTTVGLPLEVRALWRPLADSDFGLGVIAYANVNARQSFFAILAGVQLAWHVGPRAVTPEASKGSAGARPSRYRPGHDAATEPF